MQLSWLETAGKLSLYLFLTLVAGSLITIFVRVVLRKPSPVGFGGPLTRFLFEYVANLSTVPSERRRNQQARLLIDRVREEMARRAVPLREREELVDELRKAMRTEARLLEMKRRDIQVEEQILAARRTGLAARVKALLGDPPPEIIDGIQAGFSTSVSAPEIAEDPE